MRPLTVEDLEPLRQLDAGYARAHGIEPHLSLASANFHARSGHSFVVELDGRPIGFVLANAVWNGVRAVVRATRLVAGEADGSAHAALTETLTKSAYDAAVYDIEVEVPDGDERLAATLGADRYRAASSRMYRRTLGSRGGVGVAS